MDHKQQSKSDLILNSSTFINCEIFGKVVNISEPDELIRGNKVRDGKVFVDVNFYIVNKHNYKNYVGKAKIYIPFSKIGVSERKSIFFYNIDGKEWQTSLDPINLRKRILNTRSSFKGNMKRESNNKDKESEYTHFMTNVSKVVIFPNNN